MHAYDFQEKSIYSVRCYTLDDWFVDDPVYIVDPPSAEIVFAADVPQPALQIPLYHPDVYWMD